MKKLPIIFLLVLIVCSAIVSGCAKENSDKNPESTQHKTENSSEESMKIENNTKVMVPSDFVLATEEELSLITDAETLVNEMDSALESIGVQEILSTTYGNYEKVGSVIMVDVYVVTDLRKLIVKTQYLNERWCVVYIDNAENGNMYYPTTAKNVYDYISGKLINSEEENQPATEGGNLDVATQRISELEISGEKITDITTKDMKKYDYVKDIYISIDESNNDVNITVQVPSATDKDTAKIAGEDVARYLAAMAGNANSYFKQPSSGYLGGIYDRYDLLIYVDDGYNNLDLYGAKVTTSDKITWK